MSDPVRVTHIFLDVDGTLVDFRASLRAGLEAAATYLTGRVGREVPAQAVAEARARIFRQHRSRRPLAELQEAAFRQVLAERGVTDDGAVLEANRRFFEARDAALEPYEDVVEPLTTLRERGFILTAATNGNAALMRTSLVDVLHHTFSADEAGVSKPHPHFYITALAKVGAKPATSVMVGDRVDNDLEPAASLGMHAILIDRDGSVADPAFEVIRSLRELPDRVELMS